MDQTILDDVNRTVVSYEYAGFWRRFGALVIDYIILIVVIMLVNLALLRFPFVAIGLDFVIVTLYYALMDSSTYQGTLGRLAVGIKVVTEDGNTLSFGQAIGRFLMRIVSGMILYIGFLMMLWSDKNQTLHDLVVKSIVVVR